MTIKEHMQLTNILKKQEEVTFTYKNHFIYIQTHSEGGFEGSIYYTEQEYINEEECLDGGVCESILETIAIEFFKEISNDLAKSIL